MKKYNIAVVGATGMVGRTFLKVLEEMNLPVENYYLFASSRSAGSTIQFMGKDYLIEELNENSFDRDIDIALFSAGGSTSEKYAPIAASKGVVVIDNSSAFRMDPKVPLVVPEVNSEDIKWHNGIIANPNCSTIQAMVALRPLQLAYGIRRVIYSTYQAVSGAGMGGYTDLENGIKGEAPKKFNHPIFNNCLPQIDVFLDNGYTKEEMKMVNETKKILGDDNMRITATTVRVPVFDCHSESINVELEKPFDLDELKKVEALVNLHILAGEEIAMREMPIDEAKKLGAMALFGEKYGKIVRVVKMGDCSTEFCGGTHVDNTAKVGLFKIVSESSVAAGVRRIESRTGLGVLDIIAGQQKLIGDTAAVLKAQNTSDSAKRAASVEDELRTAKKEIEALNAKLAAGKLDSIVNSAVSVGGFKLICAKLDDMEINAARTLADDIKARFDDTVAVLAVNGGGKLNFIAVAGKAAVAGGAHAGKLVGAVAAVTGGKGGGRPDNAMAGGRDADKIDEALAVAKATLEGMLK